MTRLIAIVAAAAGLATCGAQKIAREDLGRKEKLRILVDKVMQPEEGWTTKEWIIQETVEAGFNVFSPRRGHDDFDEVRQVTQWCEKYGIYHMPWMRGTLTAPDGPEADGKRVLWANGAEQPLWSVCSDEFWEWTAKYIVEYARMSAENEHIMGVFLDYENYAPGGRMGNLYYTTYEDVILKPFLEAKGLELPELEPQGRKSWLEEQGLHDEFAKFQIEYWRERCRTLREAVDEHDPTFQFCIYPAPGTPFMVEACYPEWSTDAGPIILADPWTYGRPSRFIPQAEGLEGNLQKLLNGMKIPQEAGIPFIYAGGIDPVVTGADPEFCGKNAVMISEVTDGYWIFYEGPKYKEDHPEYFTWFTWANEHIAAGTLAAWHEPRENPEDWTLGIFGGEGEQVKLLPPEVTGEAIEFPKHTMRGENLMFIAAKAGQQVEIALQNVPIAAYTSLLAWELRNPGREKIDSGMIEHAGAETLTFTPGADGLYLLGASAGSCAYSVVSANAPIGLLARDGLRLIYGAERLYFKVPEGVDEFTIAAKGTGAETVRLNVLDPDGEQAATGQTTTAEQSVAVSVVAGNGAGGIWALEVARADEGVLEDNAIKLDPKLPPTLSLSPEHVFGIEAEGE